MLVDGVLSGRSGALSTQWATCWRGGCRCSHALSPERAPGGVALPHLSRVDPQKHVVVSEPSALVAHQAPRGCCNVQHQLLHQPGRRSPVRLCRLRLRGGARARGVSGADSRHTTLLPWCRMCALPQAGAAAVRKDAAAHATCQAPSCPRHLPSTQLFMPPAKHPAAHATRLQHGQSLTVPDGPAAAVAAGRDALAQHLASFLQQPASYHLLHALHDAAVQLLAWARQEEAPAWWALGTSQEPAAFPLPAPAGSVQPAVPRGQAHRKGQDVQVCTPSSLPVAI